MGKTVGVAIGKRRNPNQKRHVHIMKLVSKSTPQLISTPIKRCFLVISECVSVFNKDSKAVFRGCLDPTMDDLFQGRTCLEKTPDVLEVYAFVDGVFACACRNTPTILERHLCNIGFDSASGIEFKIGFLLGTPLILLVIQHFT